LKNSGAQVRTDGDTSSLANKLAGVVILYPFHQKLPPALIINHEDSEKEK
jgi:hypothetical protein